MQPLLGTFVVHRIAEDRVYYIIRFVIDIIAGTGSPTIWVDHNWNKRYET